MPGTRWTKVDARIVECFRAWDEPPLAPRPLFEIVADVMTPAGTVEHVSAHQRLNTLTHRWRAPDPGDVVHAKWHPASRQVRLSLGGDPRYDERVIRWMGRTRERPTWGLSCRE